MYITEELLVSVRLFHTDMEAGTATGSRLVQEGVLLMIMKLRSSRRLIILLEASVELLITG